MDNNVSIYDLLSDEEWEAMEEANLSSINWEEMPEPW